MPRKSGAGAAGSSTSSPKVKSVVDCVPTKVSVKVIPKGESMHRVHHEKYSGDSFNPSPDADARFSTIRDSNGDVIPVIYVAGSLEGALMESVFHDVPYVQGPKTIDSSKLENQTHSFLTTNQEIRVAELTTKALKKLGVAPEVIVTSEASNYRESRAFAENMLSLNPDIQGLRWVSRQHNTEFVYVLFGTRFNGTLPVDVQDSRFLLEEAYDEVIDLAEEIGVLIVPGIK